MKFLELNGGSGSAQKSCLLLNRLVALGCAWIALAELSQVLQKHQRLRPIKVRPRAGRRKPNPALISDKMKASAARVMSDDMNRRYRQDGMDFKARMDRLSFLNQAAKSPTSRTKSA